MYNFHRSTRNLRLRLLARLDRTSEVLRRLVDLRTTIGEVTGVDVEHPSANTVGGIAPHFGF